MANKRFVQDDRLVEKEPCQCWDRKDAERYYLQDYIGKEITVVLMSEEATFRGTLIEVGQFIFIFKQKEKTVIIYKHAVEMILI